MRFAYADPPYVGQAHLYGPEAREVNHELLVAYLREFDGWALSLSAPSLATILPLAPEARVCAWVKPFATFKKGNGQVYAWEPVLVVPLRRRTLDEPMVRDWISCPITLRRGTVGAKPDAFCRWLFEFAGLAPDDDFEDVFPGSGAVSRSWEAWRAQPALSLPSEAESLELGVEA